MELTADQQAQATSLQNAGPSVYQDLSDTDFWSQYFSPTQALTPEEPNGGISIAPAGSNYYTQALRDPSVSTEITDTQTTNSPSSPFPAEGNTWIGSGSIPAEGQNGTGQWLYGGPEGNYQSGLIKSLRDDFTSAPQAPGVSLLQNKQNQGSIDFSKIKQPENLVFSPEILTIDSDPIGSSTNPYANWEQEARAAQKYAKGTPATVDEITQIYNEVLNRDPDQQGLDFYDLSNFSADQIKYQLMNSPEYAAIGARPYSQGTPATIEELTDLYWDVFGRAPDKGGLQFYDSSNWSVDQVRDQMLNSPEYAGMQQRSSASSTPPSTEEIIALYEDVLGRSPTKEELQYYDATNWSTSNILNDIQ